MELNSIVNATIILQGIQTLLISVILFHFFSVYRKNYLWLWAWSWLFYSIYFFGGFVGFLLSTTMAATNPLRLMNASIYLAAGYLQVPLLILGAYELAAGREFSRKTIRLACLTAVALGVGLALGSAFASPPMLRFALRVSVHSVVFGIAFLIGAFGIYRIWSPTRKAGRTIIFTGFLSYGIYQLLYAALPLIPPGSFNASFAELLIYFVLVESILVFWTGLGLIVWLLEEERERAAAADTALQASEELFRKLTENSAAGIFILQEKIVRYVNPAAAKMLEQTVEDLVDVSYLSMVHPDFRKVFERNYEKLIGKISVPRGEAKMLNAKNEEVWLDLTGTPIEYQNRPAILVTTIDVTETKQTQQRLLQTQKLESIGMLAGGIAHDFNNMLTGMLGFAELALKKITPDHAAAKNLERIKELCTRAAELTGQLLAFARRQILTTSSVNLNEIVGDTADFLRRVIGENVEIDLSLAENLSPIKADAAQIRQVLTNLALNGRDAMQEGGKLTIRTRNLTDESISDLHLSPNNGAAFVELSIKDTGTGMSEETRARIFEPFFSTKEMGRGTGLGLAIVYGIIKQHNGAINVDSDEDAGTIFRIYLPAAETVAQQSKKIKSLPSTGGSETILVAEDEQSVRELIEEILTAEGYTVITAADGEIAIELYEQHKGTINLVITDAIMPKVSGEKVFKVLREQQPDLSFLFISGYGLKIADGDLTPNSKLLRKPFDSDALLEKVRGLLNQSVEK